MADTAALVDTADGELALDKQKLFLKGDGSR